MRKCCTLYATNIKVKPETLKQLKFESDCKNVSPDRLTFVWLPVLN